MTLRKISKIPVRTLTDKAEIMNKESSWLFGFWFWDSDSNPFEILETIEEIIIHVHGGGFVAGSSSLFLPCTLKWASETGVPIFSIDYRLSPNYKYPAALQDWWEIYIYIYIWILKYGKTHLNINPSKIILIGDSAGGNLIIGLTILAIQNNIKVPDQLIWAYPALDFRNNSFYPSILYGYTDLILNVNIIKVFRDAYINHEKYNGKQS